MARVLELAASRLEAAVAEGALEPGDAVRITEGVFHGYTGVVVRDRGTDRLGVRLPRPRLCRRRRLRVGTGRHHLRHAAFVFG